MGKLDLSSRAYVRMYNLRLLKIFNSRIGSQSRVHLPQGLEFLSEELRYLHWDGFPLSSMPSNFQAENLVQLNLAYSKIKQLWTRVQVCFFLLMSIPFPSKNATPMTFFFSESCEFERDQP